MRCSVRSMPGAVVVAERADVVDDVLDVLLGDLAIEQDLLAATAEARLGTPAEVHDDLDQVALGRQRAQAVADLRRQGERAARSRSSVIGRVSLDTAPPAPVESGALACHRVATGTRLAPQTRTAVSFISSDDRWRSLRNRAPPGADRAAIRRSARRSRPPVRGVAPMSLAVNVDASSRPEPRAVRSATRPRPNSISSGGSCSGGR